MSLLFSLEFLQEVGFARQHWAMAGISTLTELVVLLLLSFHRDTVVHILRHPSDPDHDPQTHAPTNAHRLPHRTL